MSDKNIETQLRLSIHDLNRQISLLKQSLLEKEGIEGALQESEKRYRRLFESAKDGILILDANTGKVVDINPFLIQLLGYSYDEFRDKHIWEIGPFKDIAASKTAFKKLQEHEYIRYENLPLETRDGQSIAVEFVSNVYLVDQIKVIQCNIRDITERKQAEAAAEAENKRLLAAIEQAEEAFVITDVQGTIQFVNPAFERTTGYTQEEAIGQNSRILKSGKQDKLFYRDLWDTISSGRTWAGRMVNKHKNGTLYTEEMTISPVRNATGQIVNYVAVKRDITEQLRLATQYLQSQKMEALGLLAGGVAHDYNNMLTVILGYTELAMDKLVPPHPLYTNLEEILKAAKRSSDITRQLLGFARQQTINPVVLDLTQNVEGMVKMLRCFLTEDIDLTWEPAVGLWPIKIDPVQVDQILANLCVNARDAIVDVGKISIKTENAVLDEIYCADHAGMVPGEYILLTISDDGCGMDEETLNQIFEPFFTRKEVGQGTGLGLSTVYGIVKQNNGFIFAHSKPGIGTTFKIFLPRYLGQGIEIQKDRARETPLSRGETVLLVEDEPALLEMSKTMLEQLGYRMLTAGTPDEAIRLARKHAGKIHILITDVVMPGMNGRDMADWILSLCPSIKVLFVSGYTADVIAHRGILNKGVNFLQKPFSMKDLAVKIQDVVKEE